MKRATLILVGLLAGSSVDPVQAGLLDSYTTVEAAGSVFVLDSPVPGGSSFRAGPESRSDYLANSVSGSAGDASLLGIGAVGGGATAYNFANQWYMHAASESSLTTRGVAGSFSRALQQDIIFMSHYDPSIAGNRLRLNFSASGQVLLSGDYSTTNSQATAGTAITGETYGAYVRDGWLAIWDWQANAAVQGTRRWETFESGANGTFRGTYFLDIPLTAGGGYVLDRPGSVYYQRDMQAIANIDTLGFTFENPSGIAHASDPNLLVSITLPDVGNVTPESLGITLTFDSGVLSPNLQPTAIPEPGSLALLATAAASAAGFLGWRGKRATSTTR